MCPSDGVGHGGRSVSSAREATSTTRVRDRLVAALLFALTWLVFWNGTVEYLHDSKYTLLLAQNLLAGGGFELDRHFRGALDATSAAGSLPYQLKRQDGHVFLAYPNASAYLALPGVVVMNRFGLSVLDGAGEYDPRAEMRMQRILACLVAATLTAVLYLAFRVLATAWLSALAALTATLGSVVLSNLTRALWAQSWAALLVGLVCWQLLRDHRESGALRPAAVGSALAWLALVRPPALLLVACVLGYLLAERRRSLRAVNSWMLLWWLLAGGLNLAVYGSLRQPSTYRAAELFSLAGGWQRTWDVLASPSRGLLVFMPWVLLAALALLYWRRIRARGLTAAALVAALLHLGLLGVYTQWVGGACYGPRLWAELVPLLALAALGGFRAALDALRGGARAALIVAVLAACGWSLFVHVRGAYAPETHRWNRFLRNRELRMQAIHDWRHPQFLAGLADPPARQPGPAAPEDPEERRDDAAAPDAR